MPVVNVKHMIRRLQWQCARAEAHTTCTVPHPCVYVPTPAAANNPKDHLSATSTTGMLMTTSIDNLNWNRKFQMTAVQGGAFIQRQLAVITSQAKQRQPADLPRQDQVPPLVPPAYSDADVRRAVMESGISTLQAFSSDAEQQRLRDFLQSSAEALIHLEEGTVPAAFQAHQQQH